MGAASRQSGVFASMLGDPLVRSNVHSQRQVKGKLPRQSEAAARLGSQARARVWLARCCPCRYTSCIACAGTRRKLVAGAGRHQRWCGCFDQSCRKSLCRIRGGWAQTFGPKDNAIDIQFSILQNPITLPLAPEFATAGTRRRAAPVSARETVWRERAALGDVALLATGGGCPVATREICKYSPMSSFEHARMRSAAAYQWPTSAASACIWILTAPELPDRGPAAR